MNNKKIVSRHFLWGALLTGFLCLSSNGYAVDPCSQTTQLSGGRTISNKNETGYVSGNSGYHYEIWRDGNGGNLTLYSQGCAFKADWNNAGDFLGRVGLKFNSDKKYTQLGGDLIANYAYKKSGDDGGS